MKIVKIVAVLSTLIMLAGIFPIVQGQPVSTIRGPRFDLLQFPIYGTDAAEFAAFDASDIEIVDWSLAPELVTKYSSPPFNATVTLDPYTEFGMFEFDVNNNLTIATYPGNPSPTNDPAFRTACNYFVDRNLYVSTVLAGLAEAMFTMGWPSNPTFYNTSALMADFNPTAGDNALDLAGYTLGADPTWRDYPLGHPKAGQNLDPLVFYIRSDDALRRLPIGRLFAAQLTAHKIPLQIFEVPRDVTSQKVMAEKDYNFYTGGWSLSADMDWIFDLFHSSSYWHPGKPPNQNNVNDPILDAYAEDLKFATTIPIAQQAVKNYQGRWQQISPIYPLWHTKGFLAHKNRLVNVVNQQGVSSFNFWTFYGSHMNTSYNGGTLKAGFKSDIQALNPLYSQWVWDAYVLGQVYDSLMARNPYTLADQAASMAQSWETGTWVKGTETYSVFTFHLRPGIKWHDGVPVTSADIKFTWEYIQSWPDCWLFPSVQFIDHVTAPDPLTVIAYMNVTSVWAIHNIQVYMIPQHIWAGIADPHGFSPDADLVGSGPWIGDARAPGVGGNPGPEGYIIGSLAILRANRNYYLYNHPKPDVNWDGMVDIYDIITVAVAFGAKAGDANWDIKGDITADWYLIDIYDLILVAVNFGITWGP